MWGVRERVMCALRGSILYIYHVSYFYFYFMIVLYIFAFGCSFVTFTSDGFVLPLRVLSSLNRFELKYWLFRSHFSLPLFLTFAYGRFQEILTDSLKLIQNLLFRFSLLFMVKLIIARIKTHTSNILVRSSNKIPRIKIHHYSFSFCSSTKIDQIMEVVSLCALVVHIKSSWFAKFGHHKTLIGWCLNFGCSV